MEFVSLASGSKGNCYYLASNEGAFLVDCGISMKRIEQGVAALGKGGMDAIRGILLTHEHRDHIAGLGPVLRRHHIPVYGTRDTLDALEEKVIGKVDCHLFYALDDEVLTLADFHISYSRLAGQHFIAGIVCFVSIAVSIKRFIAIGIRRRKRKGSFLH